MCQLPEEKKKAWIAISGTMASGKSSVLEYLKQCGYPVYDCDKINASLQNKGEKGYEKILCEFGEEYLDENEKIDTAKLAKHIFSDPQERKKLEQIIHPLILEKLFELKDEQSMSAFVEVPLLYELGWEKYFDEDWLIIADERKLVERCTKMRHMDEEEIYKRLNAQMKTEEKKKKAKVIIENNDDLQDLYKKIDQLLERSVK